MTDPTLSLSDLRAKAEAAIAPTSSRTPEPLPYYRDAYIAAANPEAILALIARLESAEAALRPLAKSSAIPTVHGFEAERPLIIRKIDEPMQDWKTALTLANLRAAAAHFNKFKGE